MDSEVKDTKQALTELLGDFGDGLGTGLAAILGLKYSKQFEKLLKATNEARLRGQEELRNFAARGSVVIARQMWLVILPILLAADVVSIAFAWQSPDLGFGFATAFTVKLLAFVAGVVMYVMARRVKMSVDYEDPEMKKVEDGTEKEQQKAANKEFGRPWLLGPMIFTGFAVLVMTMGAIMIDVTCLVNEVSYFISMFLAMSAGVMGWIIIRYVRTVIGTIVVLLNMGIDLVGGGWSGIFIQIFAVVFPGVTRKNVSNLLGFTEAEQEIVKQKIREASRRPLLFFNGVYSIWMIWYIAFHEFLALGIEFAVTVVLLGCLFGWIDLLQEFNRKLFKQIVLTAIVLGVVMFFIRLIEAPVGPNRAEIAAGLEHAPVLFYHRMGWLLSALFGWVGSIDRPSCALVDVSSAGLFGVFVLGCILSVIAARAGGGRRAFLVGALAVCFLVPSSVLGAAHMFFPGHFESEERVCFPHRFDDHGRRWSEIAEEDDASPPESDSSMHSTVIAGSHEPPGRTCSRRAGASNPCP